MHGKKNRKKFPGQMHHYLDNSFVDLVMQRRVDDDEGRRHIGR